MGLIFLGLLSAALYSGKPPAVQEMKCFTNNETGEVFCKEVIVVPRDKLDFSNIKAAPKYPEEIVEGIMI